MNEDQRLSEPARREAAQASIGSGIEEGAQPVRPRSMTQMTSVRLELGLVKALRAIAGERQVSISDLLREAAIRLVSEYQRQTVHVTLRLVGDPQQISPRFASQEPTSSSFASAPSARRNPRSQVRVATVQG